jgi:hypothetical protein
VSLGSLLGVDSLSLLRRPSFLIFVVCSFLLCIPLAGYYAYAGNFVKDSGFTNVPVTMSFGQMSEVAFMLVMPLCFAFLGVKWMLAAAMLGWVVRYVLFAAAPGMGDDIATSMILAGIILHGICYDFFFVAGQIYVDKVADKDIRAQTQGFLVLVTQGLGMLVGAQVIGYVARGATTGNTVDWRSVWLVPCAMSLVVLVVFVLTFRDTSSRDQSQPD